MARDEWQPGGGRWDGPALFCAAVRSIEERRGCQLGDRELLPFQRKGEDGDVDFGGKATDADGPMLDGRIQDA